MPSAPDLEIILTDDFARGSSGSFTDGEDMFLTIDTLDDEFPTVERPRALVKKESGSFTDGEDMFLTIDTLDDKFPTVERPRALVKKESLQKEKQVSVDPMSLVGPTIREASFTLVSTPPRAPRSPGQNFPSPLPPPKLKFVTTSLPSSAASSPRSRLSVSKKPWKGHTITSPECPQPHQHWAMDDTDLALQEMNMRKSRSEGEGRASVSADDFSLMIDRPSTGGTRYDQLKTFSKPRSGKHSDVPEDGFKCGKLCLFLPRGKGKAVRAGSSNSISSFASKMTSISSHKAESIPPLPPHKAERTSSIASHKAERTSSIASYKMEQFSPARSLKMDLPVISRRVSLERFDLGSASSSAMSDEEGEEPTSLFFDLPLEMIRYSVSEVQSTVTAAFVFDKDAKMENEPKGVLKNVLPSTGERKSVSQDPNRHVRFSTSSARSSLSSPSGSRFSTSSARSLSSLPSESPGQKGR